MNRTTITKAAFTAVLSLGAVAVATTTASAQRLNFNGSADLRNNPGSGGSQLLIDFLAGNPPVIRNTNVGTVNVVPTTTLMGVANGDQGVIQDLVVDNSGVVGSRAGDATPVSPFLTVSGYTFSLDGSVAGSGSLNFGPIALYQIGNNTVASFAVNGTVTGGALGTDSRNYRGVFTAQFADQTPAQVFNTVNSGGQLRAVAFSAEFKLAQSTIPEPSTYALMGTGIAMLGLTLRRRRAQG